MTSGVNEILWHFVGHFHLTDELARARDLYDQSASRTNLAAWSAPHGHEFHATPGLEDLDSAGVQVAYKSDAVGFDGTTFHLHSPIYHSIQVDVADPALHTQSTPSFLSLPAIPATGTWMHIPGSVTTSVSPHQAPDSPHHVVHEVRQPSLPTYTYENGGHDKFIRVEQSNTLADDDQVSAHSNVGLADPHGIDVSETLHGLIETANEQVPDVLRIADHGPVAIVDFIEARDTSRATATDDPGHEVVAPGRYVNGVLTAASGVEAPANPGTAPEHPHDTAGSDQVADLGGNTATNAALIVDVNEATSSLIVVGDYFRTNAIVQTNVLMDNDQIATVGATSEPDVAASGNRTDNIAEFVTKTFAGDPHGSWHDLNVKVDTVNGDFFDVKSLVQKNWLFDNDTVVQSEYSAYAQVRSGGSDQVNAAKLLDWSQHYDLIIVGGDYHQANLIFQTNILLDNDVLKSASALSDPDGVDQSAHAGDNTLTNEAKITNHGTQGFDALSDDLSDFVTALGQHGAIDPLIWDQISGSAYGTMNVLYITGDYYDLNVISQINIVADVDFSIQFLEQVSGAAGGATQHVTSGGNTATNAAEIYDVGSAYDQFLGGEYYEDSLLVQANLVEDANDVRNGDTDTLVSEVIAFTGWDESDNHETDGTHPTVVPGTHDDVMGGVLS